MATPLFVFHLLFLLSFFSSSPNAASASGFHLPSFKSNPVFPRNHANGPPHHKSYRYETRYFSQVLDHFSFKNLSTFQQRYLISVEHWSRPSSPIFFYCGNEGDIEWFAENTGFVWEIAPRFGAMVLFAEVSERVLEYNCVFLHVTVIVLV